jgi:hypothetical protein
MTQLCLQELKMILWDLETSLGCHQDTHLDNQPEKGKELIKLIFKELLVSKQ